MRPIDADEITATLEIAISMMENTKSIIGVENLPVIDVEIKAYTDILKGIKEQPTVQPEPKWIPVSEGLPKKDGRYQVTRHDYVTNTEFIDILWYEKNTWWDRQATGDYAVTAWMPLPEAYKEGGEKI